MNAISRAVFAAAIAAPLALSAVAAKAADIVDTAVSAGQFETLVAAVKAAGLVATLKGAPAFTVFAPPENKDQLVAILTYHVVPGKVMAADIANKQMMAKTVEGQSLDINALNGGVSVDNAKVIQADIEASNGVIHVIDSVVLPQ